MIAATGAAAVIPARPGRAESLVQGMTLAEKLGQLSILSADYAVTGPAVPTDLDADVRAGRVGSLSTSGAATPSATPSASRSRKPASASRCSSPSTSSTASAPSSPSPSPRPAPSTPPSGSTPPRAAAAEAAAAGLDLTFAPMLDVARDPRWGRIAEGPGEDPSVAAAFATPRSAASRARPRPRRRPPKHFAAYGASTAGRDYAAVDVSDRTLAEVYLPPFRAAVDAGRAGASCPPSPTSTASP